MRKRIRFNAHRGLLTSLWLVLRIEVPPDNGPSIVRATDALCALLRPHCGRLLPVAS